MSDRELWIVLSGGEAAGISSNRHEAINIARDIARERVSDFYRDLLPFKVTPVVIRDLDVEVHPCFSRTAEALPFQEWIDDLYRSRVEGEKTDAEREYQRFVELREKYEARFQAESTPKTGSAGRPTNCS